MPIVLYVLSGNLREIMDEQLALEMSRTANVSTHSIAYKSFSIRCFFWEEEKFRSVGNCPPTPHQSQH